MDRQYQPTDSPGFLQQIGPHVCPLYGVLFAEPQLDVLPESTAVVVSCCFGVADGLHKKTEGKMFRN